MVKKEEYELSVEAQKEVNFVSGVVKTAQATVDVAVAVASTRGNNYQERAKDLKGNLSKVAEQYAGNLVELNKAQVAVAVYTDRNTSLQASLQTTEEVLNVESARSKTLEERLKTSSTAVEALIAERDNARSQYNSEKKASAKYYTKATQLESDLANSTSKLNEANGVLAELTTNVLTLSRSATSRTSAVQTLLQTYFGVPESTFKGVAEDKKEEFVYKLLDEKVAERAARDKTVEEELNSALSGNVKDDKAKETNGQKLVNRVKATAKSGNGK